MMMRRILSLSLALLMIISYFPVSAFSSENMCTNHPVHDGCSYQEESEVPACTHAHDAACTVETKTCLHENHDDSCTYSDGEEEACCHHVCSTETGCIVVTYTCEHLTDGSCCMATQEAVACNHSCELCNPPVCDCEVNCADGVKADCPVCGGENADLTKCRHYVAASSETTETTPPPNCTCATKCADVPNANCEVCGAEGADLTACTSKILCAHGTEGDCSFCTLERQIAELPTFEELVQLCETDEEAYGAAMTQVQTVRDTYYGLGEEDQKKISNANVLMDLLENYATDPDADTPQAAISFPGIEDIEFLAGEWTYFDVNVEGNAGAPDSVTLTLINDTTKEAVGDPWDSWYGNIGYTFNVLGSHFLRATATYSWGTVTQDSPVFEIKKPDIKISFPDIDEQSFAKNGTTHFSFEIADSSYQSFEKIQLALFSAETDLCVGDPWELDSWGYTEFTPTECGQFYIQATVVYPWGEVVQNTPEFTVHEGIYPSQVSFTETESTIGQDVYVHVTTVGSGSIASIEYVITDADGNTVQTSSTANDTFHFQPLKTGTYYCQITLKDTAGNSYTKDAAAPLVVGNYLYLDNVTVSNTALTLGESVTITAETLGQGSGASFEYRILDSRNYTLVESIPSQDPTLVYTPKQAGRFCCEVIMTNNDDKKVSSYTTEEFQVYTGLWLERIVTESSTEVNAPVTIMAFTKGQGTVKEVSFQIYAVKSDGDTAIGDPVTGTSLVYHFDPGSDNTIDHFYVDISLTDEQDNVSTLRNHFYVTSANNRPLCQTDKEEYTLGQTVNVTLNLSDSVNVSRIRYEFWDMIQDKIVHVVDNTTDHTCAFTPTYGSQYQCQTQIYTTGSVVPNSFASDGFQVIDTNFQFNEVTVTPAQSKPGEEITFACNVSDKAQIQSVHCFYRDHMGRMVDVYKGAETTWKFTSNTALESFFTINIVTKNGSAYQNVTWISVTDEDACTIDAVELSANRVNVGEPVTLTLTLGGSKAYQAIEYQVYNHRDGSEEVFVSQSTTFTYIPDEASQYHINITLTQKDGSTQPAGFAEFYATDSIHLVDQWQRRNLTMGQTFRYEPKTAGEGSFVYLRYELSQGNKLLDSLEGTQTYYEFTPNEAGSYTLQVTAVNDEGLTFQNYAYWEVYQGRYLSEIKLSHDTLSLGETLTITPVFQGDGSIIDSACYIYKAPSSDTIYQEENAAAYTWTAAQTGTYQISVFAQNDSDNISWLDYIIEVKDDLVSRPTVKPSDSSMDLTQAESSTMGAESNAWAEDGKNVNVTMDVDYVTQDANNTAHQKLDNAAGDKTLELLDITIEKDVDGVKSTISETKVVQEIKIPYHFSRKANLSVYRVHDGEVHSFRRLAAKPATPQDGTFYADLAFGYLYVYSNQFSLFGIAYDPGMNITYMDGTNVMYTDVFALGEGLSTLWTPTKSGYRFIGWADANGEIITSIAADTKTDVVLYAIWEALPTGIPSDNPPTGDLIYGYMYMMVFSGAALLFLLSIRSHKNKFD